jgi:urease accessory protein
VESRLAPPLVASVVVRANGARSDVLRARGAGPLKLLTPRAAGNAAWIVTSSLGGGLVDGDSVCLEIDIEDSATAVVTTQASTKAYKGRAQQELRIRAGLDANAIVVPDHLVPFANARVKQVTHLALAPTASLVSCDILTAGRIAHGEVWACERVDMTLSIERGGSPRLVDRVVLDRAHGSIAERLPGIGALATCVLVGPRVAAHARAVLAHASSVPLRHGHTLVAASPLDEDGVIVRIAGASVEQVIATTRVHLAPACDALGEDPWARKW